MTLPRCCFPLKYKFPLRAQSAKTGGTSRGATPCGSTSGPTLTAFPSSCAASQRLTATASAPKFPRHAKAIAAQEMLPREVYEGLFKFAFVRNPWDLQVSSWHHIRRERRTWWPALRIRKFPELEARPRQTPQYQRRHVHGGANRLRGGPATDV